MNELNQQLLDDLGQCLEAKEGVHFVHEHSARHRLQNFTEEINAYKTAGWKIMFFQDGETAFLESPNGNRRLEIIPRNVSEHEGFLFRTSLRYDIMEDFLILSPLFQEFGEEIRNAHIKARMFRHLTSDVVIQIVWRQRQIYHNLF